MDLKQGIGKGKELVGGLTQKLGLNRKKQDEAPYDEVYEGDYYEDGYGDGYGDYGEFDAGPYGYADDGYGYDQGYGYDEGYEAEPRRGNAGTRARNVGRDSGYFDDGYGARRPTRTRGTSTVPRLLTMDEVRERTRAVAYPPDRPRVPSGSFVDDLAARSSSAPLPRQSGSVAEAADQVAYEQPAEGHSGRFLSLLDADPDSAAGDVRRIRALTVLAPTRYGEAERITEVLKKDDVAVLDLRGAAKGLDKRILDFSFGAASVLDATVECVADKVFVVCTGTGLTPEERTQLQQQGVI